MNGLKELREGSLYEIISSIVGVAGAILLIMYIFSYAFTLNTRPCATQSSIIGILAILGIVILVSAIIGIIGIVKLRSGFNLLSNAGFDVSIGSTGALLVLISLGVIILGAVTITVVVGIFILEIAGILALVGDIMLGLGFYNLGKGVGNSTIQSAGILIIVGGIISLLINIGGILNFIAFILIYTAIGGILSKGIPYVQQYSQLLGVIKGNGYAYLTVYSQIEGNIISARIEGTSITSTTITPNKLSVGSNSITVYFGNLQLIPSSTYIITLTVQDSMGRTILIPVNVQYQPF